MSYKARKLIVKYIGPSMFEFYKREVREAYTSAHDGLITIQSRDGSENWYAYDINLFEIIKDTGILVTYPY